MDENWIAQGRKAEGPIKSYYYCKRTMIMRAICEPDFPDFFLLLRKIATGNSFAKSSLGDRWMDFYFIHDLALVIFVRALPYWELETIIPVRRRLVVTCNYYVDLQQ